MAYSLSSIAPKTGDIWKPNVGDILRGTITFVGDSIGDDFDKKGGKQKELRVDVEVSPGVKVTVYGTLSSAVDPITGADLPGAYPSRFVTSLAAAVEKGGGGTDIEIGAQVAIQRVADVPSPRGQPAKDYYAEYQRRSGVNLAGAMAQTPPPVPQNTPPAPSNLISSGVPVGTVNAVQADPFPGQASAPAPDWAALSARTGLPEATLRVLTPEQLEQLTGIQQAPPAPTVAQGLAGLLAPPVGQR